ncbi:hypothetical protein EJ06DRAFT_474293 [Trichodelitschia bisporula]|uniref:Swi5-domain-containing protein n=1 Tax=Trichodelitschia bisporula TaxID=703511 RepID=A0A6G1I0K8_9PEZI|nr:hypothetical protein EJ06DRAFT_474293 [Trichodelitschia bisporula]
MNPPTSAPPAKRRRVNALHKPFVSPLKRPNNDATHPSTPRTEQGTATTSVTNPKTPQSNAKVPSSSRSFHTPLATHAASSHQTPQRRNAPTTPTDKRITSTKIRSLEASIIRQRQDIDILRQAVSIASSTKGAELEELTVKWRDAARLAAEEVFAGARDRVNRMGGVGAWRDQEKERKVRQVEWQREEMLAEAQKRAEANGQGEEAENGDGFRRDEGNTEETWDYEEEGKEDKETDNADYDESFTMDMMLKTLNIDLDLIGYNKRRQMWVG